MPTYRLDLAYDGSGFHGYARQPGVRTVQGDLEVALFRHTGEVETAVAGRTDRGVHACGQVVSFAVDVELDRRRLQRSLNRQLVPEIAVIDVAVAPDGFHARHSALARSYRYRILNRPAPDPFLATTAWHYEQPLDEAEMDRAIAAVIGEHDFATFCKRSDRPTVRRVEDASWVRNGAVLDLRVTASSFCHQMVRSLVAASVDVGRGKLDVDAMAALLAARDRDASRGASPPHGLMLTNVRY